MNRTTIRQLCVGTILLTGISAFAAEEAPPVLKLTGDWQVQVTLPASGSVPKELIATLNVSPPTLVVVRAEKYDRLPPFNPDTAGWVKGVPLVGLRTQETTSRGLLDPSSLQVRVGSHPDAQLWELGKDYAADLDWATVGRLPGGRIAENMPVYVDYRHALLRIDSIVLTRAGQIVLREGTPQAATPQPPSLAGGDRRLANVFLPGRIARLEPLHLLPILETGYPESPKASPSVAELKLPKTMKILREGGSLRILAWGDSVTDGGYLPDAEHNRWQAQFATRLREQFPRAKIELVSQGWGGRNSASFLAEPAGSPHNYQENVLGAKPDLIVSEFVNDAGLSPDQVEEQYGRFLADFTAIGAEWIVLTPHYVRPDWMGLNGERDIDADPRPYVAGLRQFAARHPVALADASLRWGRLWRQGIPYSTLLSNAINHPNPDGMKLFADSLMALFP